MAEDSGTTVFTVLTNDTDVENDPITVTGVGAAAHGTTSFTPGDVSYKPADDYCGPDSFTYTINGGSVANVNVTVTCVNDAPKADLDTGTGGIDSTATFLETSPHTGTGVLIAPNGAVTDIDDTNIESMTVVLTNRPDGDAFETLSATLPSGITGTYVPATGTFAFTGTATKAAYTTLLTSIRYDNTKAVPNTAPRIITVVVNDGDVSSLQATATVTVVDLNAPPVNTVPGAQSTNEDTAKAITGISVADPDNATLTETLSVTHGTLTLASTAGLSFTVGDGTNDATMTFTGAKAAINTAIASVTYTPATDYNGPATLTISSTDGTATDTDTVAITVVSVNDQPVATAHTVTTSSGIGLTINAATDANDLKEGATDPDDPSGELTAQLVAGSVSPANATVTLLSGSDGSFYVEPPGGLSGAGAVTFAFKICDDNVGDPNQCSAQKTLTVDVTGPDLWFVDDTDAAACAAACNGSRTKPLVGLAALPAGRGTGDRVFLFSGSYAGGHTFPVGESLVGQGATGSFDTLLGVTVPGNGTLDARPTLGGVKPSLGNTVTLATNATLRGVLVGTGAATALTEPAGTTTGLTVAETSLATTTGTALLLDQAAGNLQLDAVTHTGGAGAGVGVTNNSATLTFSGGLSISSGTSTAFSVTGGGTVAATQDNTTVVNTLTTTTGTALSIQGTTIGASGLAFRSVASNGAVSGIVLSNTGSFRRAHGHRERRHVQQRGELQWRGDPGLHRPRCLADHRARWGEPHQGRGHQRRRRRNPCHDGERRRPHRQRGAEQRQQPRHRLGGARTRLPQRDGNAADPADHGVGVGRLQRQHPQHGGRHDHPRGQQLDVLGLEVQRGPAAAGRGSVGHERDRPEQHVLAERRPGLLDADRRLQHRPADAAAHLQQLLGRQLQRRLRPAAGLDQLRQRRGREGHDQQQPGQVGRWRRDHRQLGRGSDRGRQPGREGDRQHDQRRPARRPGRAGRRGSSIWGWAHGDGRHPHRGAQQRRGQLRGPRDGAVAQRRQRHRRLHGHRQHVQHPRRSPNTFEGMYILSGGAGSDTSNVCVDLENNDFDGIGRQGVSDIAIDRFTGTQLRFADFNDTSVPNLQTNLRGKNPASPSLTVQTFSGGPTATTATACTLTSRHPVIDDKTGGRPWPSRSWPRSGS